MRTLIVVILLSLVACARNTVPPEQAAKKWLADTQTAYVGEPACTGGDTDRDGYVTCLIRLPKTDNPAVNFFQLKCAVLPPSDGCAESGPYTTGCKPL